MSVLSKVLKEAAVLFEADSKGVWVAETVDEAFGAHLEPGQARALAQELDTLAQAMEAGHFDDAAFRKTYPDAIIRRLALARVANIYIDDSHTLIVADGALDRRSSRLDSGEVRLLAGEVRDLAAEADLLAHATPRRSPGF